MAGDWIKMRTDLHDDPAVVGIALATGLDAHAVVGRLHRLWSWADKHTVDGIARNITDEWIDALVSCPNFSKLMRKNGWLRIKKRGIEIPNFEVHNGETGKQRALTAKRVAAHKSKNGNGQVTPAALPKGEGEEEERRGEGESLTRSRSGSGSDNPSNGAGDGDKTDRALGLVRDQIKNFPWEELADDACKIASVIPAKEVSDRSMILKACFLVRAGVFSEAWLWESWDASKGRRGPAGYFMAILKRKANKEGVTLNAVLKAIDIPPEILQPKAGAAR